MTSSRLVLSASAGRIAHLSLSPSLSVSLSPSSSRLALNATLGGRSHGGGDSEGPSDLHAAGYFPFACKGESAGRSACSPCLLHKDVNLYTRIQVPLCPSDPPVSGRVSCGRKTAPLPCFIWRPSPHAWLRKAATCRRRWPFDTLYVNCTSYVNWTVDSLLTPS